MSYYWYKRQELLQKEKEKYNYGGKEKAAEYYLAHKDAIKEKANNEYKNLSEEQKEAIRKNNKDRYEKMNQKSS